MEEDCPTCGCPGSRSKKPVAQLGCKLAVQPKQTADTPENRPEFADDTMENAAPGPPRRVAPTKAPPTEAEPVEGTNEKNTGKTKSKKKKDPNQTPIDPGRLQSIAASILMKILYAARLCRYDLLRATCRLAQYVIKWTVECDKRLLRLIRYIDSSKHLRQAGWVGDSIDKLEPHLYADSDFAGCEQSQRSTSGAHLNIEGPNTRFPIIGRSVRQGCVSTSTPEAEIVAGFMAYKNILLPSYDIWDALLGNEYHSVFHEDNQAMIRVTKSGKNPTMKHLNRCHRVSVAWLH